MLPGDGTQGELVAVPPELDLVPGTDAEFGPELWGNDDLPLGSDARGHTAQYYSGGWTRAAFCSSWARANGITVPDRGRLRPEIHQGRAEAAWEDYWAATRTVELTESVTTRAGELARRHALRGADAVHLASLLAVGAADTLFAVWDQRLRAGAQAAGVQLAPLG